jgi:hypothetical protein
MGEGLASRAEDLVGGGEAALEAYGAASHQLSAVSFPPESLAPAKKSGFIR